MLLHPSISLAAAQASKSTTQASTKALFDEKKADLLLVRVMEARNLHYALEGGDDVASKHSRNKSSKQVH